MIRLDPHREPKWFDLIPGVRVKVSPVTSAIMLAARRDPRIEEVDVDRDPSAAEVAVGKALARLTIVEWEGIGDADGNPAAVTAEHIDALLDLWPVWLGWAGNVLSTFVAMSAEKNASAPLPNGSSEGAQSTAEPVKASAETAPAA